MAISLDKKKTPTIYVFNLNSTWIKRLGNFVNMFNCIILSICLKALQI